MVHFWCANDKKKQNICGIATAETKKKFRIKNLPLLYITSTLPLFENE